MSTDYGKLIERVRDDHTCTDALHSDLADAVKALVAESERRSKSWEHAIKANSALIDRLAERDAEVAEAHDVIDAILDATSGTGEGPTRAQMLAGIAAALTLPAIEQARARRSARIREAKAEAWDEGLTAGADRWMDSREFGDPPVNPYRSGTTTEGNRDE